MKKKARIENIADKVLDRLWWRFLRTVMRGIEGYYGVPEIPPKEEALCKWSEDLPQGAEFDKDVDLNLIVDMYPLTGDEIEGAIRRTYKFSIGQAPSSTMQRKQDISRSRSAKIIIRDEHLRMGIVWALGDKVLLERINAINEAKVLKTCPEKEFKCQRSKFEEEICKFEYWCKRHPKDENHGCWSKGKKFEGKVSSYCEPSPGKTGFKCPENVGFDCNSFFSCHDDEKFIFDCDADKEENFKCSNGAYFDCGLKHEKNWFRCWAGKDFECKPIPENPDAFVCKPKKEFKCSIKDKFEDRPRE